MTDPKVVELQQEVLALQHAMQTGVLHEMSVDDGPTTPKHLRAGVNSAIVQNSALAMLLMRKGVITEVEYWETQVEFWHMEVAAYESRLSQAMGLSVKLI